MLLSDLLHGGFTQMVTLWFVVSLRITQVRVSYQNWKKKLKGKFHLSTRISMSRLSCLIKKKIWSTALPITVVVFIENVPRMFADDLAAEIDESKVPVCFQFSKPLKYGQIKHEEMFEIFNMGVWDLCWRSA